MTRYDAFISYSHAGDGDLAPALQAGLQRLAKPWSKRRALEVFRDETGLAVNPDLWGSIVEALDGSAWFVLLASPGAAESKWVDQEVERWLASAPDARDRILPVLTSGTFGWDSETNMFTADTDAAPPALAGAFASEPRHIDLSWARHERQLDLDNPRFRQAVAEIAAPIHGVSQDELVGEDVRLHSRAVRIRRIATATLIAVTLGAVIASVFAVLNARSADRNARLADLKAIEADENAAEADANAREAEANAVEAADNARDAEEKQELAEQNAALSRSRELAAIGESLMEQDPEVGALLAVEALWPDPERPVDDYATPEAMAALGNTLNQLLLADSHPVGTRIEVGARAIAISPDGSLLATTVDGGRVEFWNVDTGDRNGVGVDTGTEFVVAPWMRHPLDLQFSPDGVDLLVTGDDGAVIVDVSARSSAIVDDAGGVANWLPDGSLLHSNASGDVVLRRSPPDAVPVAWATIPTPASTPIDPEPGITAIVPTAGGDVVVAAGDARAWRLPGGGEGTLASLELPAAPDIFSSNAVWAADPVADIVHRYSLEFDEGVDGFAPGPDYPVSAIPVRTGASNAPIIHTWFPVAAGTLALSDDGAFAAAVNGLDQQGLPDGFVGVPGVGPEVQVWKPEQRGSTFKIPTNQARDVAWVPGTRTLAIASRGGVEFLSVTAPPTPTEIWAMEIADDWSRMVTWDAGQGTLSVWDAPFVEPSARYDGPVGLEGENFDARFEDMLTIGPDGGEAALLVYNGDIRFIDLQTGAVRTLTPPRDDLTFTMPIEFSPSGDSLFVGSASALFDDQVPAGLLIIDASSGAILHEAAVGTFGPGGPVSWADDGSAVLFTQGSDTFGVQGSLVEYELDGEFRVFDPEVVPVSLDVAGGTIAAGLEGGDVLVIERGDDVVTGRYRLHDASVQSIDISDDGSRIISAGDTIVISSSSTGERLWSSNDVPALDVAFGWREVEFDHTGRSIAAGTFDGFALISDFDPALACRTARPDAFDRLVAITGQTSACERITELSASATTSRPPPSAALPSIVMSPVQTEEDPADPPPQTPSFVEICPPFVSNEDLPLQQGQRGVNITVAQGALVAAGYRLDVDGCFGPGTAAQVRAFQSATGIEVDGLIGPATWQALTGLPPP